MSGKIIGYAHDFCNKKIRENQNPIPVFAHNLFSFDFFFVVKRIRLCVWQAKQLNLDEPNLTNVQYANIGSQVKFIDIIKYYQQPLSCLAKSAYENEKENIRASCEKFIQNHPTYSASLFALSDDDKKWILDYLCGDKVVIPYKKIKFHEDLDSALESKFYKITEFYSFLKNEAIKPDEYENIKKFWQKMRRKKLLDLNDIYNFQDTITLFETVENVANQMMNRFSYNPRKDSSANSLSSCIHRFLSKTVIALPAKAEIVELFE